MINKLKNLVGGNSNGFYLEADETDDSQSKGTTVEKATTTKVTAPVEAKAPEPVAAAAETVPAQSTKKSNKTSIKDKKKKATGTTTTPTPASSNGKSSYEEPSWVQAMYKNNGNGNGKVEAGEKTFATDNLLPIPSNYRRRPGPSLDKFKEMARQARIKRR